VSDPYDETPPEAEASSESSPSAEHLLVETIRQVGVSNYSLIARLTGLNPETVRYKVNKQLARIGLSVQINVDFSQLGFIMGVLRVRARRGLNKSWLDSSSYLSFVGKMIAGDVFICLCTVPFRFKKKYIDSLELLRKDGLIEEFEWREVSWVRYPPLRSESFDFASGSWRVNWQRLELVQREAGLSSNFPTNSDTKVDYFDVRILRAMQEDPTVSPAKIAKDLDANPRTVRYHYLEHVLKNKLILGNNVRWVRPILEGKQNELMQIILSFKNLEQTEREFSRKLCNRIPFTWLEAGTLERDYFAFLDIPVTSFHETMAYVEQHAQAFRQKFEMIMLDPMKSQLLHLPAEMYDEERGWRLMPSQERATTQGKQSTSSQV
jgi:DNA-binding Lrp family transcriptional regulator